jgi:hypothetical protein
MRTVRPQGPTFRITQLYGLRVSYLRMHPERQGEGHVVSEQGKEAVIAMLGTNDFFGEGCLAGLFNVVELFRTKAQGKRRSRCCRQFADECRRDCGWKASATSLLPPRLMPAPCAVQAVNIQPIMNRAVGTRPGIEIDPRDWNGLGEVDPLLAALSHRIDNGVPNPMLFGIGVQQPTSQIVDTIDSHASMREEAIIRRERLLRGRIVHIDRLTVWHVDTQCAQGIFAAWLLAES